MLKDLPELIDPIRLAQQGVNLRGLLPIAQMTRIHDSLCDTQGDVAIDWQFSKDEQARPIIQGTLKAQLVITCQRCLQPMVFELNAPVALMILRSEQDEEDVPEPFEALTLEKTPVSLSDMIEDELVLAIPIVTYHEQCPQHDYVLPDSTPIIESKPVQNPFTILSTLKKS
ncbi:putative metal-binding protein, possibly nucleic-acid binding [Beggiatoa alba B18LD]|uniref:Large ribosomal RNA subunit accumulation protein YceD n=1 Tax=Beggiatoa alba B18LD TaxID=395493 RepID=I3CGX0_9GAMM|nr:YceD family protein [Beggiatoa alba]EIJ42863.1 putative metal-binding protein, possibly nucleic-acid binding [Beggiatoa alba B18LD]